MTLKGKLVQVIVATFIVILFQKILNLKIEEASDLAYIALSILLISISSYLLQLQHKNSHKSNNDNH